MAAGVLRLLLSTLRVRVFSAGDIRHPSDPSQQPFIYAFWHESLLAPAKMKTPVKVLISRSADGELIAQVCARLGIGVVRGSSKRGGMQALLELLREDGQTHLAITPDGPRGPRREVQQGVVFLSSQTGLPIMPVGIGFTRAWRAGSWDRFALPLPGSQVCGVLGEPILVPSDADRSELETYRQLLESAMLTATQQAEAWARDASKHPAQQPQSSQTAPAPHQTKRASAISSNRDFS